MKLKGIMTTLAAFLSVIAVTFAVSSAASASNNGDCYFISAGCNYTSSEVSGNISISNMYPKPGERVRIDIVPGANTMIGSITIGGERYGGSTKSRTIWFQAPSTPPQGTNRINLFVTWLPNSTSSSSSSSSSSKSSTFTYWKPASSSSSSSNKVKPTDSTSSSSTDSEPGLIEKPTDPIDPSSSSESGSSSTSDSSSSSTSSSASGSVPAPTPTPMPGSTWKNGDVNLDGVVNAQDATLVLKYAAKNTSLSGQSYINADVNGDGYINVKDATEILKIAVSR